MAQMCSNDTHILSNVCKCYCETILDWKNLVEIVVKLIFIFSLKYPDLIDSLGTVYEMMNARTKLFPQLAKLQGKLQLVMSQVSSQAEALQTANEKDIQPLLYYQDSTSEDEQIEDELIPYLLRILYLVCL